MKQVKSGSDSNVPPRSHRRVTWLEALVVLIIVVVIGRFLYHTYYLATHWNEVVADIKAASAREIAIAAIAGIGYYLLHRYPKQD